MGITTSEDIGEIGRGDYYSSKNDEEAILVIKKLVYDDKADWK
jgi:hypothetical protein